MTRNAIALLVFLGAIFAAGEPETHRDTNGGLMGREVRMVPPTWKHPVDTDGKLIPMLDSEMPTWDDDEMTYWMMYETCSEGTPISPAFATPNGLARWLADTGASAFGSMTATYEQWLGMIREGWAPSAGIHSGVLRSEVECIADKHAEG